MLRESALTSSPASEEDPCADLQRHCGWSVAARRCVGVLGMARVLIQTTTDSSSERRQRPPARAGPQRPTTLTMGLFGTFGFKENGLYDQYKKVCPNITIQEDVVEQSADYWTRLKTRLASGSGLADVQAIEIGFVSDVVQNHADQFVNWNDVPNAAADKAEFYDWKWQQATSRDGSDTVGLGTDTGPMSMCYRSDLLEGRPGCRSEPGERRQEVDDVGRLHQLRQGVHRQDRRSRSSTRAASIFSTAVYQGDEAYNNADGEPDVENSDGVQTAWKLRDRGSRRRHHRWALAVLRPVEQGVLQWRVRRDRLPHVDDGLHPGPGR